MSTAPSPVMYSPSPSPVNMDTPTGSRMTPPPSKYIASSSTPKNSNSISALARLKQIASANQEMKAPEKKVQQAVQSHFSNESCDQRAAQRLKEKQNEAAAEELKKQAEQSSMERKALSSYLTEVRVYKDGNKASVFLKFSSNAIRNMFFKHVPDDLSGLAVAFKAELEGSLLITDSSISREVRLVKESEKAADMNCYVDLFISKSEDLNAVVGILKNSFLGFAFSEKSAI
jgi:hypothetical protein